MGPVMPQPTFPSGHDKVSIIIIDRVRVVEYWVEGGRLDVDWGKGSSFGGWRGACQHIACRSDHSSTNDRLDSNKSPARLSANESFSGKLTSVDSRV